MDKSNRNAAIAAAIILGGFGLAGILHADDHDGGRQCLDGRGGHRRGAVRRGVFPGFLAARTQPASRRLNMHILITGAAGMIGRKLTARLLKDGKLAGRAITALDLHDIVPPETPAAPGIADRGPYRRSRRARRCGGAGRGEARHRLPSGRHRVGRGRVQFRPRLPRQFRRHAGAVRRDPARRPPAARRLHLVDRGVRRAVPRRHLRRFPADAAHLLRHAEADRRADPRRLYAARLLRRRRHPAADHLRAAGQAQQGGVELLFRHHPRAAGRPGGDPAGAAQRSCTPMPARARR